MNLNELLDHSSAPTSTYINPQNGPQTASEDEFNKYLAAPSGDASSEPPRLYTREDMARAHTQGYLSARRGESREANPYT